MHSKSFTYLTSKEYDFDVKLPTGFYSIRENNTEINIDDDLNHLHKQDDLLSENKPNKSASYKIESIRLKTN